MLYRNPETVSPQPRLPFFGWFDAWRNARRRRRATLDLLALSDHMRRDIGLIEGTLDRGFDK